MRRVVLITISLGIPLLWALAPYGRMPPGFAMDEPGEAKTFAGTLLEGAREIGEGSPRLRPDLESAMLLTLFPALASPLYPAAFALRLLAGPRRLAARRRWAWQLEGALVLLLCPVGVFWAALALVIAVPGASSPTIYPTLWLLPGFAMLAAAAAIAIGIGPRSRIARFVLGSGRQTPA
jgi:hypothetical protein